MKISSSPLDRPAASRSSPSSMVTAMMPPARGREKADSGVFLMMPRRVASTTYSPSANSRTASIVATRSSGRIWIRLTTGLALARRADLGDLVHLEPVQLPAGGEDQDVVVGRGDEEVAHGVLVAGAHADAALAAALLRLVGRQRRALDVAGVADRDHHVLFVDEVLDGDLVGHGQDLGAARVAVLLLDLLQLVDRRSATAAPRWPGCPAAARSA